MLTLEKRNLVLNRLTLIKNLIGVESEFKKLKHYNLENNHHTFKDYAALLNYLALTCFDIIGQQKEYIPFQDWLNANKAEKHKSIIAERNQILQRYEGKDLLGSMKAILKDYNEIYSVSNSFYNFIRQQISSENKDELMNSISILTNRKITNDTDSEPQYTPNTEITPGIEIKEKFLFKIRNNFTHKGISNSSPIGGIVPWVTLDHYTIENGKKVYPLVEADYYSEGNENFLFQVERWPFVLIKIIEDTLKSL